MTKSRVRCPECGQKYDVDPLWMGRTVRCKKCPASFVIRLSASAAQSSKPQGRDDAKRSAAVHAAEVRQSRGFPTEDSVPSVWQPGDLILDLYEVQRVFESGGMGLVYQVHHKGWNLPLAVKSPRAEFFQKEQDKQNFEREAETWVNLGLHPHIVSCHYVRRLGGIPRVFAEYMEAGSLKDWIDSGKLYADGPESALERILDIAIQFAWGLHYAHEQGLIHQDVKPANVLMTEKGTAKVSDFGLAKAQTAHREITANRAGESILVSTGGMTPAYCSPEQANQQPLSRRTDLWSWAVSILEMFTGDVTWYSGVAAVEALEGYLDAGVSGDERVSMMPRALMDLLRRCFQHDPQQRPKDMRELATALAEIYREVTGQTFLRSEPHAAEALANSLNNRAVSMMDLGKPEEAEVLCQQALQIDPHHLEATYNFGLRYWRTVRATDSDLLRQLREVAVSRPGDWWPQYMQAHVHAERGDCEGALVVLATLGSEDGALPEVKQLRLEVEEAMSQSRRCLRVIDGHTHDVTSVSFSRDGRCAVSGSMDGPRLWDISTGKCLRKFERVTGNVTSVSWSPDSRYILSGSLNKTLQLLDVATGKCLRTFEGHTEIVTSVSFSDDGRFALSGSWDKTLRLWDVATGKCLRTFEGHAKWVTSVSFAGDGRSALSGDRDGTLKLWKVSTGRCLRSFEICSGSVNSVSWNLDGRYILSGSSDKTLRLWVAATGKCLRTFEGHTAQVNSVSFIGDGRLALSGGKDNTLRLWDVATGKCLRTFEGHTGEVTSVSCSRDGRLALSGGKDKTLRLWEVASAWRHDAPWLLNRIVTSYEAQESLLQYRQTVDRANIELQRQNYLSAAQQLRAARSQPGYERHCGLVTSWTDLYHHLPRQALRGGWESCTFKGHMSQSTSVKFSSDGQYALSGSCDNTLRLWEVATGKCLRTFEGHTHWVTSVSFTRDSRCALSGSWDKTLRLWDVATGTCLRTFEGHTEEVTSVSISSDSRYVLSGSHDKTLRLWDVATGKCLRTFEGHLEQVHSVSISSDDRCALSGSDDKNLRLWDMATGKCLRTFVGHTDGVQSVSFSSDTRYVLSGSLDKTLRLWDVATGQCLRTFQGHMGWVNSVSFSSDDRCALSGSRDNTLRLWDVATGTCMRTFEGHTQGVSSVNFSADIRYALSGSEDRSLKLWILDWELTDKELADWDDDARQYLATFLSAHMPYASTLPTDRQPTDAEVTQALTRSGQPVWSQQDFNQLLYTLGCAGYGWLRPEGVRHELRKMTTNWQGPPPLS